MKAPQNGPNLFWLSWTNQPRGNEMQVAQNELELFWLNYTKQARGNEMKDESAPEWTQTVQSTLEQWQEFNPTLACICFMSLDG